jgi:hypothetical protein
MKLPTIVNPIAVTKGAFGLAGTAVGLVDTVARQGAHIVLSGLHRVVMSVDESDERQADPVPTDEAGVPKGPTVAPVEPHAPEEPPIDVVGRALAAEAALGDRESPAGAGVAHEPRGASRDEEHGDAPLQRAEVEGIADEVAAALEGEPEPPEHLTQPLLDPADAKALAAEMRTASRGADPHKT